MAGYSQEKLDVLAQEKRIIRNRRKIAAGQIVYENDRTTSELSNQISADLKKRGMKFVGSTIESYI